MATSKNRESIATFALSKAGPNGRPVIEVGVVGTADLGRVAGALTGNITRNVDILKKLGLKACPACISGADIWIRHRFDDVIQARF